VTGAPAELITLSALVLALAGAVLRPRGLPEVVFAVPGLVAVLATGCESWPDAQHALGRLASTVAFLGLILLIGHICAEAGVFDYLGAVAARACRGNPVGLLALVVAFAAAVTTVLTLDATVVLLTPVVLRTSRRLRLPARPHAYACLELANAGSLLLPVSNLTNLLAFTASGLSFAAFARSMALPWVIACVLEFGALWLWFRNDLRGPTAPDRDPAQLPRYAMAVLVVTVAGFVIASGVGIPAAWAALGGVVLLAAPRFRPRDVPKLITELNLGFCAFVLALGVIVDSVTRHGLGSALRHVVPSGTSLMQLLALAFLAAAAANIVNNLPATLLLAPLVSGHPVAVLAVLLGVNIGPNATYAGSLATLLWRRLLPSPDKPRGLQFHAYGLVTVPVVLAACTFGLWAVN
jgi:arsenical pump membrane protein